VKFYCIYIFFIIAGSMRKPEDSNAPFVDLTEILGIAGVPTILVIHPDGNYISCTLLRLLKVALNTITLTLLGRNSHFYQNS
jgi:hypothetical protein